MAKFFQPEQEYLSNGIPVVFQHYEGPVAATYWWVKTGSADENPKEAGFAHFLEHMLFKDAAAKETGRASTGKMARAIESLGGDINAYTSFDQTVYHVTCAAPHWERVVDAFGTIAKPQRFLKTDFEREREVILEELRKNEDSPSRQLFQTLFGLTFKKHPYGKPVIGFAKTLRAASVADLERFYRRTYVSGNMGLILVGPVQDQTGARRKGILKLLEKRFGSAVIKKTVARRFARIEEAALRPRSAIQAKAFDVKTPTLGISFRAPELLNPDTPALDLLAGILGMGELSRLYQRLFYQTSLATEVSGGLYVPYEPGMLFFQAELDSSVKINPSAEEIFKEARRLRDEGPSPDELARVVVNAESERLYSTQTADGMAGRLGFLRFVVGDLDFDQNYLSKLRAVDPETIREMARQYLEHRRLSAVALIPKGETFDTTEIAEMAGRLLPPEEDSAAVGKIRKPKSHGSGDLPVEFISLPSGMRVAYFHRPQSHVFSIHASALGGLRLELTHPVDRSESDWGASNMMSLTWTKGTSSKNARDISAIVEGHAASCEGFSGRNSVGVQMTGLARDWNGLSRLFSELLLDPVFPEDEVEHSRRIAEDSVKTIEDHSAQLCSKLFLETLYETHPYGKLTYGSLESIKSINQKKLQEFQRRWIRPERLVLAVSGPVNRAHLETWLAELDVSDRQMAGPMPAIELPHSLPDEAPLNGPRWVERKLDREQCHILVGGLGTRVNSDDRHAVRLLQTILGGQSGRLFIELREKKSLAYSVAPISFEGLESGYIGTYIASAPQKREEAIAGIRAVLEKLAEQGPSDFEMDRAKEFYLGRRAMDLQSDSALATHFGLELLYQVPHLAERELIRKVRAISAREIQKVCRQYLIDKFMVTSVVG